MPSPIIFQLDADGIAWVTLDEPASKANVFKKDFLAAFKGVIQSLRKESGLKAAVILSAKESIFVAGADIRWMFVIDSKDDALAFGRDGQSAMDLVAQLGVPTVAAIHGACAGGGYELALACSHRIASDSPKTLIGLPEIGLGIIPGWGGCVRLPRLIGVAGALDHILKAQLIPAAQAMKAGLVDELVAPDILKERARTAALRLIEQRTSRPAPTICELEVLFADARKQVLKRTRGKQPAPVRAIDVIEKGFGKSTPDALEIEARGFADLLLTPECKNLMHVFLLRDASKKAGVEGWFTSAPAPSAKPTTPKRVGVVGAGVMGSGIAQWCASRGLDVSMRDVKPEFVAGGMKKIEALFQEGVKRGKLSSEQAAKGVARVKPTTEWDGFEACDLVIEAVIEDIAVKRPVFEQLSKIMRPDAILATNTSAIPIDEIAACATNPGRVIGIHFFNPVSRMPLVEILLGPRTERPAAESATAFVKAIGKSLVVCKDSPGFLVNRILLPYMNDACRLVMDGVPVEAIDAAILDFGMPMGPLRLVDEVGVDVTHHIMRELTHYFGERMKVSDALTRLNDAGLKGRKAGKGFYAYEGSKESLNTELAATIQSGASRTMASDEIQKRLVGVMVREAKMCLAEGVVRTPDELDLAMILGTGFPTFRGGLMRYAAAEKL